MVLASFPEAQAPAVVEAPSPAAREPWAAVGLAILAGATEGTARAVAAGLPLDHSSPRGSAPVAIPTCGHLRPNSVPRISADLVPRTSELPAPEDSGNDGDWANQIWVRARETDRQSG